MKSSWGETQRERLAETDWDVLLVLDACSASALAAVADWPVETVVSPASCTPQWIKALQEMELFDRHVVAANPQYEKFDIEVDPYYDSHWNDRLSTVLPEPILDRITDVGDDDTDVVAHLQQPHWPYVARFDDSWRLAYPDLGPWGGDEQVVSTQVAMACGYIDVKQAKQAYEAAVHSVWSVLVPYVKQWADQSLTTVITADHGETFGRLDELGFYEHPCRCNIPALTRVPWVQIEPDEGGEVTDSTVQNRLNALGYVE
jgi:hypothetical protein